MIGKKDVFFSLGRGEWCPLLLRHALAIIDRAFWFFRPSRAGTGLQNCSSAKACDHGGLGQGPRQAATWYILSTHQSRFQVLWLRLCCSEEAVLSQECSQGEHLLGPCKTGTLKMTGLWQQTCKGAISGSILGGETPSKCRCQPPNCPTGLRQVLPPGEPPPSTLF